MFRYYIIAIISHNKNDIKIMMMIMKKISRIFLLIGVFGLLADKFIPHTHHNGSSAIIDFSSDASPSDPKENEEAGEKIHSEYFSLSETSNSLQEKITTSTTDIVFALNTDFPIPDIPLFIIEKYFLLGKIININHLVIKYFTYKAPPQIDVPKNYFININIYRRSYYERIKGNEITMV